MSDEDSKMSHKDDTLLVHSGRDPQAHHGIVNPPVYHASTVLFPSVEALRAAAADPFKGVYYGIYGTPTSFALQDMIAELEHAHGALVAASGKTAILVTLLAFTKAGDHVLIGDNAYGPTRQLADHLLKRYGIETTYFDPMISPDGLAALIRPETRLVMLEAPGSLTFEVQDVPGLAAVAKRAGVVVAMDNTWASPLCFKPLDHGVDVSIHAATKYMSGHSDVMMGTIAANADTFGAIKRAWAEVGAPPASDDCYLVMRGMRTMSLRLERHEKSALALARWMADRPEVARVLHPALPECPGHEYWKRDFDGSTSLFAVQLHPVGDDAVARMLDHMTLFKMGFSWGGYESLILPADPSRARTATNWDTTKPLIRIHAGLEAVEDLIADLEAGFERLNAVR